MKAAWGPDNNVSRRHFSAVAYYFARDLQKALGVPVGVSLACEGGTRCQYWTPMETFESKPEYKEWLDQAIHARANFMQIKAKFEVDQAEFIRKRKAKEKTGPHPAHYGRQACYYYNGNIHPIRNYTLRGAIWYQGERNSMTTKDAFEYRTYFPLYKSAEVKGSTMVIRFDHVGKGLMSNDGVALREFTICGEDPSSPEGSDAASWNFVPAEATIAGKTVVVSSPQVTDMFMPCPTHLEPPDLWTSGPLNLEPQPWLSHNIRTQLFDSSTVIDNERTQ